MRSSSRISIPAFWASWADTIGVLASRFPDIAVRIGVSITHGTDLGKNVQK